MNQKIRLLSIMAVLMVIFIVSSGCSSPVATSSPTGNSTTAVGGITQSPAIPLTTPQTKSKIIDPNNLFNYFPPTPSGWTMSNTIAGDSQTIPGAVVAQRIYRNPSKINSYVKIGMLCYSKEVIGGIEPTQGCEIIDIMGNSALVCPPNSPSAYMWIKKRCSIQTSQENITKTEFNALIYSIDYKGLNSIL